MRPLFFAAVDVLPRAHRIDDDLLVPMVRHRRDDAIDVLVVEQRLVATCHRQIRPDDLTRQRVPSVVEVAGGDTFDALELDRVPEQPRPLHPHPDDAETDTVARLHGLQGA